MQPWPAAPEETPPPGPQTVPTPPQEEAPPPDADTWVEPEDQMRKSDTFSWLGGQAEPTYQTAPDEAAPLPPPAPAPGVTPVVPPVRGPWWRDPMRKKKVLNGAMAAGIAFLVLFAVWLPLDLDADGMRSYRELAAFTNPFSIDTDGDGLTDGWEYAAGLAANRADGDGDGLPDGRELELGSDPKDKDSDDDGLTDGMEARIGSDPTTTDSDGDGLADAREVELGTSPIKRDSDDDGLEDLYEVVYGTDPLVADTDGDGVPDGIEVQQGGDPFAADSDGDGLPDSEEARLPVLDCNGDGIAAIRAWDDDGDGLKDADERAEYRCDDDVDGDGVVDGAERAHTCITQRDCDGDGLSDGIEVGTEFDPLLADTFNVGLYDSVSWIFKEHGQSPSRDEDRDAIPDDWERSTGLIDWGGLRPQVGRKDLLVEFVRVQGPDSSQYSGLDLYEAYRAVADAFAQQSGITMQYVETRVNLPVESRPPLIPSSQADYYENVLSNARYSKNPYVTTVVMNPQHDISEVAHAGAAPIRGMLATVDYGQFVRLRFENPGNFTMEISPYIESAIAGGRTDILSSYGVINSGKLPNGEYFVQLANPGARVFWTPFWFKSVRAEMNAGPIYPLPFDHGSVQAAELASTIMHEMGHTLGLCHAHESSCSSAFSAEDRLRADESSMSYNSPDTTLRFLSSEWSTIDTYLRCPPEETIVAVVEGADAATLIDRKYGYTLDEVLSVDSRRCGTFATITEEFAHEPDQAVYAADYLSKDVAAEADAPSTYALPERWADPAREEGDFVPSLAYVAVTLLVTGGAGVGPTVWRVYVRDRLRLS